MSDIVIRTATTPDAQSIVHIHIQSWQEAYQAVIEQEYLVNLPTTFDNRLQKRQEMLLKKSASIHLVAEYEGEITGFCDAAALKPKVKFILFTCYKSTITLA